MKVSYVNHMPDSEEEMVIPQKQLQHSLLMAIKYENIDLIEPLLSKGTPLTEPLSNGLSALMNACEVGNELIIEKLLIRSVRSFNLFPSNEVLHTLEWLFKHRLYRIIDLTFFSIKQSPDSMKKYGHFIEAVEALEKIADPEEKENHDKLKKHYKKIISSSDFRDDFYYYLYYVWKKIDKKKVDDAIELYQILSEAFEKEQHHCHKYQIMRKRGNLIWNIGATFFICSVVALQLYSQIPWMIVGLTLAIFIGFGALSIASYLMLEYRDWGREMDKKKQRQNFLKAAREGNYQTVSEYLESEGYVNVMEGVAESTPLREAERFDCEDVKVLLRKFGAFSAEGSETLNFPQ